MGGGEARGIVDVFPEVILLLVVADPSNSLAVPRIKLRLYLLSVDTVPNDLISALGRYDAPSNTP